MPDNKPNSPNLAALKERIGSEILAMSAAMQAFSDEEAEIKKRIANSKDGKALAKVQEQKKLAAGRHKELCQQINAVIIMASNDDDESAYPFWNRLFESGRRLELPEGSAA